MQTYGHGAARRHQKLQAHFAKPIQLATILHRLEPHDHEHEGKHSPPARQQGRSSEEESSAKSTSSGRRSSLSDLTALKKHRVLEIRLDRRRLCERLVLEDSLQRTCPLFLLFTLISVMLSLVRRPRTTHPQHHTHTQDTPNARTHAHTHARTPTHTQDTPHAVTHTRNARPRTHSRSSELASRVTP